MSITLILTSYNIYIFNNPITSIFQYLITTPNTFLPHYYYDLFNNRIYKIHVYRKYISHDFHKFNDDTEEIGNITGKIYNNFIVLISNY